MIDLNTPSGRLIARNLITFGAYESEHRSERLKTKHAQLLANGQFEGGLRPLGYGSDGMALRPDEAAVIVDAKNRLLAGESWGRVVADFHERGFAGLRGTLTGLSFRS
jgi:DNA invertase Pin-like site-specific DNA recombinase